MHFALLQRAWGIAGPWRAEPLTRGTNNLVQRVEAPTGSYVVRVYSNTTDAARLRFERDVLAQLTEMRLPFALPTPLPTVDGAFAIETESGYGAVLMTLSPYIHGQPPDRDNLDQATAAGEALGRLTQAMARLDTPTEGISWRSSGDLARCHPLVPDPPAAFANLPLSDEKRQRLISGYAWLIERIPDLYAILPQQLAHEDFDPGNVLMEGTHVTGVLDFEFCARDLRAMDLTVALTWWPVRRFGTGEEWPIIVAFASGYARHITLTDDEIEELPTLFRLRAYTSLIHRLGRSRQGLSTLEEALDRAEAAINREDWVHSNDVRLIDVIHDAMSSMDL
ncbi:MAG TPA: phosphotransferase [Ktedonobacterales bacterium]